ncbi:MAG: transketolase family protein [Propioniciclava sp.]
MTQEVYDNRQVFADTLIDLASANPRIVAVCNDSVGSSNLTGFRDEFPDRLINVGIAEQDMVGVGAGLANAGMIPFVSAAAPFLTGRATEQIKADIAYSQAPVILCGQSPGMAYGALGPTHHSVEDYSWLRALPGLDIVVPADREETKQVLELAAQGERPIYLRVGRTKVPDVNPAGYRVQRGVWPVVRPGSDVAIIANGAMVAAALAAADILAEDGLEAHVLNAAWLSPLDEAAVASVAASARGIVTVEEANVAGGLGAAVASLIAQGKHRVPMEILGLREFAPTGPVDYLFEHFGLTAPAIADAARKVHSRGQ